MIRSKAWRRAGDWNDAAKVFMPFRDKPEFRPFLETFLKNGAPAVGSVVKLPDHARTLRELAETNCESFYRGRIAAAFDAFSKETGGLLRAEDLAAYRAEWVEPIRTNYKGYEVCEIPPNGHGIVALMTLTENSSMARSRRRASGDSSSSGGDSR